MPKHNRKYNSFNHNLTIEVAYAYSRQRMTQEADQEIKNLTNNQKIS